MKITVTTSSQKLSDILSEAQTSQATASLNWQDWYFRINIQNLGAQDVYLEYGGDAAVLTGVKIAQWDNFSFADNNLWKLRLISDGANNTDVRLMIN
jgi:hypothetical protein